MDLDYRHHGSPIAESHCLIDPSATLLGFAVLVSPRGVLRKAKGKQKLFSSAQQQGLSGGSNTGFNTLLSSDAESVNFRRLQEQCDLEMKCSSVRRSTQCLMACHVGEQSGTLLLIILNLLALKYVKVRSIISGPALIKFSDSIIRTT